MTPTPAPRRTGARPKRSQGGGAQTGKNLVQARKLSHLVADALRAKIASGELLPGDKLASEPELLGEFGVSRPTLREALRVIESEGLIQLGRGARTGAKVLGPSIEAAARYGELYLSVQKTTLAEVHQVRTLLEPSLIHLLATDPRSPRLKALRDCVEREQESLRLGDYSATIAALNDFHRLLNRLSRNHALNLLAGIIEAIPTKIYARLLATGAARTQLAFKRRTNASVKAHAKVVELILAGRDREAETFWRAYQTETAAFLEKSGLAQLRIPLALAP